MICFLYRVNTNDKLSKRLIFHSFNTQYNYTACVNRRKSQYQEFTLNGYSDVFINLNETPIIINGKQF